MISTLYAALRLDHFQVATNKGKNMGVETLGYTDTQSDGAHFIETVAARDVHGKDWSYKLHGDPFYDPLNEEGRPAPEGKFAVWDEDIEQEDSMLDRPSSVVASASVFSEPTGQGKDRLLLRSYKLCRINPLVADFVRATTEGDREMERQMRTSSS
jgi:hypothetical protein